MIAGCGGAPSEGVVKSLMLGKNQEELIGMGSELTDLILSSVKKYKVPYADSPNYESELLKVLNIEKPDLIHFQNDLEIFEASKIRDKNYCYRN